MSAPCFNCWQQRSYWGNNTVSSQQPLSWAAPTIRCIHYNANWQQIIHTSSRNDWYTEIHPCTHCTERPQTPGRSPSRSHPTVTASSATWSYWQSRLCNDHSYWWNLPLMRIQITSCIPSQDNWKKTLNRPGVGFVLLITLCNQRPNTEDLGKQQQYLIIALDHLQLFCSNT